MIYKISRKINLTKQECKIDTNLSDDVDRTEHKRALRNAAGALFPMFMSLAVIQNEDMEIGVLAWYFTRSSPDVLTKGLASSSIQ